MATVRCSLSFNTNVTHSEATDLGTYQGLPKINYSRTLSSPTKVWFDERSVATDETIDVTALTDIYYGTALAFTNVQTIQIENESSDYNLVVGGGADPLYGTDQVTVKGTRTFCSDSEAAVSGSAKNIRITATAVGSSSSSSGGAATYKIIIVGT